MIAMLDTQLKRFSKNSGTTPEALVEASSALGRELPSDYVGFLRFTNGGEGMIGDTYVILWKAEELAELNDSYGVDEYAPGLLLIGSDGGGDAFAYDTRTTPWPIVRVPFVGMDLQSVEIVGPSFAGFLEALSR